MIETFITIALMFGATQNGPTVCVDKNVADQVRTLTSIDAQNLSSNKDYRVLHLPGDRVLIVGQDQTGSGKQ